MHVLDRTCMGFLQTVCWVGWQRNRRRRWLGWCLPLLWMWCCMSDSPLIWEGALSSCYPQLWIFLWLSCQSRFRIVHKWTAWIHDLCGLLFLGASRLVENFWFLDQPHIAIVVVLSDCEKHQFVGHGSIEYVVCLMHHCHLVKFFGHYWLDSCKIMPAFHFFLSSCSWLVSVGQVNFEVVYFGIYMSVHIPGCIGIIEAGFSLHPM